jgi:ribonucleoside-diphosphate reductase alpha chain
MNIEQEILSDITSFLKYRKYNAQLKRRETWDEMVTRNKNMHLVKFPQLNEEIENAYKYVYQKKVLPSMRALQFSGKPIDINNVRIYNCAYLPIDEYRCFNEIMFLLLSGTGVGYSVQNHHIDKLPEIKIPTKTKRYLIGDSIEGWADAVKILMKSYLMGGPKPLFDARDVRPKGASLLTAGGKAPGPEPLMECLFHIEKILNRKQNGDKLTSLECHDIICHIADAVLSGGIRRAALISLFDMDDEEMLTCKFGEWYELNPQRGRANNSAMILRHKIKKKEFIDLWKKVEASNSGEPGIYFSNDSNWGTNPCCEVALRPYQFCNLTTINVSNIESQEDLNNRARAASFIGTLQASYTNFHYLRDIWKKTTEKDALIGVSMTGIASGVVFNYNLEEASLVVCEENATRAKQIGIKPAARNTVIKPEGTSSLVLGTSSGAHDWHDDYYLRYIRLGKNESLYMHLAINHPELVEDDYFKPSIQAVVFVPQKAPEGAILRKNTTAIQLLERVKKLNIEWIKPGHRKGENTNNVSATISIKENEWEEVGEWMWKNKDFYNGLSVLPFDGHTYIQAPFTSITKEKYDELVQHLDLLDLTQVVELEDNTSFNESVACGGGSCEIS